MDYLENVQSNHHETLKEIREEIIINLKNDCLSFVNKERKNNPEIDEKILVDQYFQKDEIKALFLSGINEIEDALNELKKYYEDIFILRENILQIL